MAIVLASPGTPSTSRCPVASMSTSMRSINPFVSAILRSRFHRMLSGRMLLLTFAGRKTGKRYTIPVGYTREGDTLVLLSGYPWWKNLRGGAHVAMRLEGSERTGRHPRHGRRRGEREAVEHLIERYGPEDASARTGLALDISPPPSPDELAAALEGHVAIRIVLDS